MPIERESLSLGGQIRYIGVDILHMMLFHRTRSSYRTMLVVASAGLLNSLGCASIAERPRLVDPSPLHSLALAGTTTLHRIAFGSCYAPQLETPAVWRTITRERPQLVLMMGDNVYQSEEKVEPELHELRDAYRQLAAEPEFAELRAASAVLATWDDHDYGLNDAGAELPIREASERLFEQVWPIAGPDPRRERPGVYLDRSYGPQGQRVQVLMLDTRFFRGPMPPFEDTAGSGSTMLGEIQWRWLEERLREPADLRILVSSIPVLSHRTEGENWHRLPLERQRLFRLLRQRSAGSMLLLSGDTHFGAQFQDGSVLSSPLHEITSSSLNFPITPPGQARLLLDDAKRVGAPVFEANFGLLEIDWQRRTVTWSLRDDSGRVLRKGAVGLGS